MKASYVTLCKSCKYRCKSRYFVDSCSSYRHGKKVAQGVQMTIYDCINGINVETLKGMEYKYGKVFEDSK
jgi:hypothetical protein